MPWHLTWQLGGTQPFCTHFHAPKPSINWTQFLIGLPSRDLHLSSCKPQVRDLKTHSCETGMLWARIPGFLTRVRPPNVNMVGTMFISVFMMTRNLQQMIYDNTCCGKAFFFFKVHACLSLPPIQHELPTCPYLLLQRGCSSWAHPRQAGTRPLNATVNPKHCISASLWYSLPHEHIPTPFCSLPLNAVNNPY